MQIRTGSFRSGLISSESERDFESQKQLFLKIPRRMTFLQRSKVHIDGSVGCNRLAVAGNMTGPSSASTTATMTWQAALEQP